MAVQFATFVFSETTKKQIDSMPPEMALKFYKAVSDYGIYGIEPEGLSDIEKIIWIPMKDLIDNSKKSRGGAPEGNSNARKQPAQQETTHNSEIACFEENNPKQPKQPQNNQATLNNGNGNDNDNDNDNVNLKSSDAFAPPEPETPHSPPKKLPLTDREPVNDLERVEKAYLDHYASLYDKGILKIPKPCVNWGQCRKLERERIAEYGLEKILTALEKAMQDNFCVQKGYSLSTILSAGMLNSLLNGNDWKHDQRAIDAVDRATAESIAGVPF